MKKIAIAVLLSAVMAPAIADMGDMDKHMYVGLRAGPANTNIDSVINGNTSGNPTGWGIFVGHIGGQFNVTPMVGIRLGWDKYRFNDNGTNGHANFYSIGGLVKF